MRRPTPAAETLRGAVKAVQQVTPVAYAIRLDDDSIRLALNTTEVAELLGWSERMVRDAIGRGELRTRFTGSRHAVSIKALLDYLEAAS